MDSLGQAFKVALQGVSNDTKDMPTKWLGSTTRISRSKNILQIRINEEEQDDVRKLSRRGKNKVIKSQNKKSRRCRVFIEESIEFDVSIVVNVVEDGLNKLYTARGLEEIRKHEARRVTVYRKAYDCYLKIFEGEIKNKCIEEGLNSIKADKYREKLRKKLIAWQNEAEKQFLTWTEIQQDKISNESKSYLNTEGTQWRYGESIFDIVATPHQVPEPKPIDMTCPEL